MRGAGLFAAVRPAGAWRHAEVFWGEVSHTQSVMAATARRPAGTERSEATALDNGDLATVLQRGLAAVR